MYNGRLQVFQDPNVTYCSHPAEFTVPGASQPCTAVSVGVLRRHGEQGCEVRNCFSGAFFCVNQGSCRGGDHCECGTEQLPG